MSKDRYEYHIYSGCECYQIIDTKTRNYLDVKDIIKLVNEQDKKIVEFENNQNAKAVEALEKVKELIEKKLDEFDVQETRITCGLFAFWIENEIDQLIKKIGEKNEL